MRHAAAIAIAVCLGLGAEAPEGARGSGADDPLYRTADVDDAAAVIVWGNEAQRLKSGEVIRIDPPLMGVDRTDDKVTVFELYQYPWVGAGTGRKDWKLHADELMARWKASLPERVEVVRIPFLERDRRKGWRIIHPGDANRVRMLMTAHVLGVGEAIDRRLVEALDTYPGAAGARTEAKEWLGQAGVDATAFDEAWESPEVENLVKMARNQHVTTVVASWHHHDQPFRHEPPILVIDNESIVARSNTTRATRAFEIANATIAAALEDKDEPSEEDLRWRALYDAMRNSYHRESAWGQMREPADGEVFELDPRLETIDDGRVEIEWFYTYINRGWYDAKRYSAWLTGHTGVTMRRWLTTVPKAAMERIRIRLSPVGAVPGESEDLIEHHRIHQRMVLGWGYDSEWGISRKADIALRIALGYYAPPLAMAKAKSRERAMRRGDVPVRQFRKAWKRSDARERATAIDARFAELNRQLAERAPHWLRAPRHPIVVVDGKYVIQGSISGGMAPAIQVSNRVLIRTISEKARS